MIVPNQVIEPVITQTHESRAIPISQNAIPVTTEQDTLSILNEIWKGLAVLFDI